MAGTLLGTLVFGVINASLVFLNVAASWQNFVSGVVLIFAVTVTAVSDMRRDRRGGRDSSFKEALSRLLLGRPPPEPRGDALEPSSQAQPGAPPGTPDAKEHRREVPSVPGATASGPFPPRS